MEKQRSQDLKKLKKEKKKEADTKKKENKSGEIRRIRKIDNEAFILRQNNKRPEESDARSKEQHKTDQ